MTNQYYATVIKKDEIVEEELFLLVNGVHIKCFASYCQKKIEEGKSYAVEFDVDIPDADYAVATEIKTTPYEMIGDGFSCLLYGYLDGSTFRSFVEFNDQTIHFDYPELNGKFITIRANRVDVAFLQN